MRATWNIYVLHQFKRNLCVLYTSCADCHVALSFNERLMSSLVLMNAIHLRPRRTSDQLTESNVNAPRSTAIESIKLINHSRR